MAWGDDSVVKVFAVQARGPEFGSSEPIQTLGGYQPGLCVHPGKVERDPQSTGPLGLTERPCLNE